MFCVFSLFLFFFVSLLCFFSVNFHVNSVPILWARTSCNMPHKANIRKQTLSLCGRLLFIFCLYAAAADVCWIHGGECAAYHTEYKIQLNRIESPKIVFQVIFVIHHVVNHIAKTSMDHLKPVLYDIVDTNTHTNTQRRCVYFLDSLNIFANRANDYKRVPIRFGI